MDMDPLEQPREKCFILVYATHARLGRTMLGDLAVIPLAAAPRLFPQPR
jgi:hypothetical protein